MTSGSISLRNPNPATKPTHPPVGSLEALSPKHISILSYIEQRFYETGLIPTTSNVANTLNLKEPDVKLAWQNERFRKALLARGLDLSRLEDLDLLTPVQLALANLLLNIHDKTSLRQKLEVLNVTTQQYNAWMRSPGFQNYLRKRAEETFKGADSEAYLGLVKAIQGGDVKAIQLFFEMRGIYNPKVTLDINIEVVLTKVIEIISRHVTNPAILSAIATDFEQLELNSAHSGKR